MTQPLFQINPAKCTLCYACVRECPVKAIEIKSDVDYAKIIPERCIGCGGCFRVCPEEAISFRSSKEIVSQILSGQETKVAIVAPSVSGEFDDITDYRKFVQMIKSLGFDYVNEVSFAADLVANHYKDLFSKFKGKHYLSSNCPVVVRNIEKFHPDLIGNLAPIPSPMMMMVSVVKKKYGDNIKVVYIGPCIAAKDEPMSYEPELRPDAVLTFVELRELFTQNHISEKQVEFAEFVGPWGNKGSLFPIGNGILDSVGIDQGLISGHVVTVEGRNDFLESIDHFEYYGQRIKKHFNIFYCNGCLMGPGTSSGGRKYVRRSAIIQYSKKRLKDLNYQQWQRDVNDYSDILPLPTFKDDNQRIQEPETKVIDEILKKLGKKGKKVKSGCASCGYDSCRDLAIAITKGLAEPEMCLSYSFKNRREYIKNLRQTNNKLEETQNALRQSKERAVIEKKVAQEAHEMVMALLHELPSAVVIFDDKMRVLQSNRNFIKTMGVDAEEINEVIPGLVGADLKTLLPHSLYNLFHFVIDRNENVMDRDFYLNDRLYNVTIFSIRKNKVVGGIIRDMHLPEVQKEQVISRVNEVIEKNLSMVQKIGFLLGEGASETEQMLNSIIESYKTEKK
ncbi:MAG: [Fe-Fe] hydrogenase large subunit C-terminal domain-containing protein [Bacteroidales bacterium]